MILKSGRAPRLDLASPASPASPRDGKIRTMLKSRARGDDSSVASLCVACVMAPWNDPLPASTAQPALRTLPHHFDSCIASSRFSQPARHASPSLYTASVTLQPG